MPEEIIVDDGGSTRIRWINTGLGHMPNLRNGSKQTVSTSCAQVGIVYVDEDGIPHHYIVLAPFQKVEIISQLDQSVLVEKTNNNSTEITVDGTVTRPLVDEKQQPDNKYRYLVSNSGAIKKILVNGEVVFYTGEDGGPPKPKKINKSVLYTCVVISE